MVIDWLLTSRIDTTGFLIGLYTVAAALFLCLLIRTPRRRIGWGLLFSALGAATGFLATWLVSDVWNTFGVSLTGSVRLWIAFCFAGIFLAGSNIWTGRWWRKALAGVSVVAFIFTAAAGINIDFGAYANLSDALALNPFPTLTSSDLTGHEQPMDANLASTWHPPANLPSHGTIGMAKIPATVSHFPARDAVVYLPPAALVANPPALPLIVMFPGQPGSPGDVFYSGKVAKILDQFAASHGGLAPIVVAPDQLTNPLVNPMCVDSPLGNASTYLTVDVPDWIRSHLNVAAGPRYWAVGGYSQGGTCAIQFGAGHPELFGSIVDILGEVEPTIGGDTVDKAFGSSQSAYNAIKPLTLLSKNAPFADSMLFVGEGTNDQQFSAYGRQILDAASNAGMKTKLLISQNTGHDWNTVQFTLKHAIPALYLRWGLSQ